MRVLLLALFAAISYAQTEKKLASNCIGSNCNQGKGLGRPFSEESRNEPVPTPPVVNVKGGSSTIGTGSGHMPQVRRKEVSVGNSEVACDVSTCRFTDYFETCDAGKICGQGGCYDCPSGSHQCPRDQGFYFRVCTNDKQCHSTGCVTSSVTGIDQEIYLADKFMCCTTSRNCEASDEEQNFRMWGTHSCQEVQDGWQVCTNEDDVNHEMIMNKCPATCAMARNECSGRCPNVSQDGRCGPLYNHQTCSTYYNSNALYCNENNGWCGNTEAHRDAQTSTKYDDSQLVGACRPSTDMPDIVLIGDSILDNKCDEDEDSLGHAQFYGYARDDAGNAITDAPLYECDDPGAVNPSLEKALTDAGFTVKSFANYGWTVRAMEELEYPELVEYAEARNNNIIIIYSGGGNDFKYAMRDDPTEFFTHLFNIGDRVHAFGDKLLQHSSLVINITPPFDLERIAGFADRIDSEIDSSIVDWYLGYDEEILIKFSEFCTPGRDGVHPDNTCAQQMHQKIIDVLNRHKCSGGSCECKDEFHGDRCEEDCWTTDTRCGYSCHNCCNGSYQSWTGFTYCSAETTMNSMSALNGTQFVGALAIFGFISLFYWIVRSFWRCYFKQSEFVKIQDAVADL